MHSHPEKVTSVERVEPIVTTAVAVKLEAVGRSVTGLLLERGVATVGPIDRSADWVERVAGRPAKGVLEFVTLHAAAFGGRRSDRPAAPRAGRVTG